MVAVATLALTGAVATPEPGLAQSSTPAPLKGGVQFLVLNTNLKAVNTGGDGFVPIGSAGISLSY